MVNDKSSSDIITEIKWLVLISYLPLNVIKVNTGSPVALLSLTRVTWNWRQTKSKHRSHPPTVESLLLFKMSGDPVDLHADFAGEKPFLKVFLGKLRSCDNQTELCGWSDGGGVCRWWMPGFCFLPTPPLFFFWEILLLWEECQVSILLDLSLLLFFSFHWVSVRFS